MFNEQLLTIGKIVAPHGVRGDVRVIPLTETPQRFFESDSLRIDTVGMKKVEFVRWHKQFILIKFSGIDTMNDAETLRNKEIVITMQELGPAPAGRYYVFDLIGLQVFDTKGDNIGELRDVIDTGANDVYIIKTVNNKELLVPAIKSVIQEVDIENKKMIIEPQIWEE